MIVRVLQNKQKLDDWTDLATKNHLWSIPLPVDAPVGHKEMPKPGSHESSTGEHPRKGGLKEGGSELWVE